MNRGQKVAARIAACMAARIAARSIATLFLGLNAVLATAYQPEREALSTVSMRAPAATYFGLGHSVGAGVPRSVIEALGRAGIGQDEYSVLVQPLDQSEPIAAHNVHLAFNPASLMKLVTTYAALSMLGPDYRWQTTLSVRGERLGEILDGDLVLHGGGDPKLVIEDLTEWIGRLRAQGLREVRGNLVIDDSLYAVDLATQAIDGDSSQPYNVGPYAALMNFKATRLIFRPRGDRVSVELDPPLAGVRIVNQIRLVRESCRQGVGGLSIQDGPSGRAPEIRVSGRYSSGCGRQSTMAAVLDHRQFIEGFFRAAWLASGGKWTGKAVIEPAVPRRPEQVIGTWVSPRPLAEVVKDINKLSNNVMARQVLLQLAVEHGGPLPATPERAREVVRAWLASRGLAFPELVIDNGSGLSRDERISAASLARLLMDVGMSDHRALFVDSLPVAGVDGTMKHRPVSEGLNGNARIKTGSLDGVRAIAGYVNAASGRRHAVIMLVNSPRAGASRQAQDLLLRWVHESG